MCYAAALTVATHWPALVLAPKVPASDKTIHSVCFGLFAFLLWRTGWLSSRWITLVIALLWSIADELAQGIPGLYRWVSWQDGVANALGVIATMALIGAVAPVGGERNRARLALDYSAAERVFGSWSIWIAGAVSAVVVSIPLLLVWNRLPATDTLGPVVLTFSVWASFMIFLAWRRWNLEVNATILEQRCFDCGSSCRDQSFADDDSGVCRTCARPNHGWQWTVHTGPDRTAYRRIAVKPAILIVGAIVGIFGAVYLASMLYAMFIDSRPMGMTVPSIARLLGRVGPSLERVVDLSVLMLLAALAIRMFRGALARHYDLVCGRCGHDLHETPVEDGRGNCGECGAAFSTSVRATSRGRRA